MLKMKSVFTVDGIIAGTLGFHLKKTGKNLLVCPIFFFYLWRLFGKSATKVRFFIKTVRPKIRSLKTTQVPKARAIFLSKIYPNNDRIIKILLNFIGVNNTTSKNSNQGLRPCYSLH